MEFYSAFEQGLIFMVSHLLWHGTLVNTVSFEGPSRLVASYDKFGLLNRIDLDLQV